MNDSDKVVFAKKSGQLILINRAVTAFENVRLAFDGEAERLGLKDINDVTVLVKRVRAERRAKKR